MSRLDELPPDQRAALSLLLRQGKRYAEVASLLGIAEQAVHDRAHGALAILAPAQARELDAAGRQLVGDYLLGQQSSMVERMRSRTLLSSSAAANAWAQAVAGELAGLAAGGLPEIPPAGADAADPPAPAASAGDGSQAPYQLDQPSPSPTAPAPEGSPRAPSSRLGGAILLAAIVAGVIVAIVLITSGGGGKKHATSTGSASATKAAGAAKAKARFTLKPPPGNASSSIGAVEVLSEGGKRAFYIQAEHIPATSHFFYAVWLYNSPTSALPLSKSPPVGNSHKLAGAALLPSNAAQYHEILLTRETSTRPTHPGHVVLQGPFSISG
jgi:hypothetical protein